jgi:hypothetical protein
MKPILNDNDIKQAYNSGELTWSDLLEITGLHASELFEILCDLINPKHCNPDYDPCGK